MIKTTYSKKRYYLSLIFAALVVCKIVNDVCSCCHAFTPPSLQSTTRIPRGPLNYQIVEQENERMAAIPDLNQIGSISTDCPAVLLHAGPGSGKSRVLSARVCHLLKRGNRSGIFVLSFSKNDALRIRQRAIHQFANLKAEQRRGGGEHEQSRQKYIAIIENTAEREIWAGTFHGLAAAILRRFGRNSYRRIAHGWEQRKRIVSAMDDAKYKGIVSNDLYHSAKAAFKGNQSQLVSSVLNIIQFWKEANLLIPIAPYFEDDTINHVQIASKQLSIPTSVASLAQKLYPAYQSYQDEDGLIDPADLPLLAMSYLRKNKTVLDKVRSQVMKHIIVDEYQDNSNAQQELLKLIVCGVKESSNNEFYSSGNVFDVPKLFCAGDANQSIYGWRGARPKQTVRNFLADFPQGLVIPLETSYRLPSHILTAAESIISSDILNQPLYKSLNSCPLSPAARYSLQKSSSNLIPEKLHEWEQRVMIKELWDPRAEAQWIATEIGKRFKLRRSESLQGSSFFDSNEIAVMVRTTSQMREIEEALSCRRIPFVTEGSPNFKYRSRSGNKRVSPERYIETTMHSTALSPRRSLNNRKGASYVHVDGMQEFYSRKEVETALMFLRKLTENNSFNPSFSSTWKNVIWGATWKSCSEDDRVFLLNLFFAKTGVISRATGNRAVAEKVLRGISGVDLRSLLMNVSLPDHKNSIKDEMAVKRRNESINSLCKIASRHPSISSFLTSIAMGDDTDKECTENGIQNTSHQKALNMTPVRVITMHRSKGDEFDDIYLCGWEEGTFPQASAISQQAIEEERRLAYVALTRARQRAVISFAKRHRNSTGIGAEDKRPSRFLVDLLERQGLGRNSVLAIAGGPSIHGIKPLVSGVDTRNYFKQAVEERNREDYRKKLVSNTRPDSLASRKSPIVNQELMKHSENLDADSACTELQSVRNDLKELAKNCRKRTGICKRLRKKWREMLSELFGLKRGSALVIDRKAAKQNSLQITDIVSMPSMYIITKPLSQCIAYELGIYLEHLLVKQSERDEHF